VGSAPTGKKIPAKVSASVATGNDKAPGQLDDLGYRSQATRVSTAPTRSATRQADRCGCRLIALLVAVRCGPAQFWPAARDGCKRRMNEFGHRWTTAGQT
jgi:hypothetical protein